MKKSLLLLTFAVCAAVVTSCSTYSKLSKLSEYDLQEKKFLIQNEIYSDSAIVRVSYSHRKFNEESNIFSAIIDNLSRSNRENAPTTAKARVEKVCNPQYALNCVAQAVDSLLLKLCKANTSFQPADSPDYVVTNIMYNIVIVSMPAKTEMFFPISTTIISLPTHDTVWNIITVGHSVVSDDYLSLVGNDGSAIGTSTANIDQTGRVANIDETKIKESYLFSAEEAANVTSDELSKDIISAIEDWKDKHQQSK